MLECENSINLRHIMSFFEATNNFISHAPPKKIVMQTHDAPKAIRTASEWRVFMSDSSVMEINTLRTKNGVSRKKNVKYCCSSCIGCQMPFAKKNCRSEDNFSSAK